MSRRPGCPNPDKDRYRDREQAEKALAEIVVKFGVDNLGTLHPYECACTRWHIGRGQRGFDWWWKRWGRRDQRFNRFKWAAEQRGAEPDVRIAGALGDSPDSDADDPADRESH